MGCSNNSNNKPDANALKMKGKQGTTSKIYEVKIVVLGESNVGKSSITLRYCKSEFSDTYSSTIGGAFLQKQINLPKGDALKMNIWDTGGSERFRSMASLYYKGASAALLVYDITNEASLTNLTYWINQLKNEVETENMILVLAGNKCDVDPSSRRVNMITGRNFAEENGLLFFETSAKNNIGVNELFDALSKKIHEKKQNDIATTD